MADGEWTKVCALMTAPVPTLTSCLLPASLLSEEGGRRLSDTLPFTSVLATTWAFGCLVWGTHTGVICRTWLEEWTILCQGEEVNVS